MMPRRIAFRPGFARKGWSERRFWLQAAEMHGHGLGCLGLGQACFIAWSLPWWQSRERCNGQPEVHSGGMSGGMLDVLPRCRLGCQRICSFLPDWVQTQVARVGCR